MLQHVTSFFALLSLWRKLLSFLLFSTIHTQGWEILATKKKSIRSTFYYLVLSMHLRDCLYQATIIECRFFKCRFFSCTFCCSEIVLKKIKGRFIRKGEWVSMIQTCCTCVSVRWRIMHFLSPIIVSFCHPRLSLFIVVPKLSCEEK